jgi:hypothetical protein
MANRAEWPDSWPSWVFFLLGASLGVSLSLLGCVSLSLRFAIALPVAIGFGILFGFLGVAFREDIILLLMP